MRISVIWFIALLAMSILCNLPVMLCSESPQASPVADILISDPAAVSIRIPEENAFKLVSERKPILPGTYIQVSPAFKNPLATPAAILYSEASCSMDLFPGSLVTIERMGVRLLLGRIFLENTTECSQFSIQTPEAIFMCNPGKYLAELDRDGNAIFATLEGDGWIKSRKRVIYKLSSGKQMRFPYLSDSGEVEELSSIWEYPPRGFADTVSRKTEEPAERGKAEGNELSEDREPVQ